MKTLKLIQRFIETRQAIGMRFETNAITLRSFARAVGNKDATAISQKDVRDFIDRTALLAPYRQSKVSVLRGLFRFALERKYIHCDPMPHVVLPKLEPMKPFIYSTDDIRRLLKATRILYEHPWFSVDPPTFRVILLLLYGAGLRISEALSLTMDDVDLNGSILTIRNSKFFKTRLAPIGPKLTRVLANYVRNIRNRRSPTTHAFFVTRQGGAISRCVAERAFPWIRSRAGIHREPEASYQPRLHDLRHTFVVHRIISWYRQGANVNQKLHQLSVYLGHQQLKNTQPYLSMTPELLKQALQRFQKYAFTEDSHD